MLFNRNILRLIIFLLTGLFWSSCVDIPADAPTPPVLNAEFRFISVNPSSLTTSTEFTMADGPSYGTNKTIAIGTNVTPSAFTIYPAGSKKIIYTMVTSSNTLADTSYVNFETDQKATLVFARNNEPDTSKKAKFFVLKMGLGYKFNPVSYDTATIVRFVNLMSGGQDTIAVRQDSSSNPEAALRSSAIVFGTSSSITITAGKKINYFFTTKFKNTTTRAFKDSIQITATPNKVKTIFIYDKFDTSSSAVNRIANVQIKELDEN